MVELEESIWSVVPQENEREDHGGGEQDSGNLRPALVHVGRYMGVEEGTGNKWEVAEMKMLRWMCGVTKLAKIGNERIRGRRKWGKSQRKSRKGG